jgi:glyoxylase-like metal-dependent hydrolase (beta-lactamase superfamily II)
MPRVTPIRLHYNTAYLVEDGGERVLVDTGPDYRGAWEAVVEALSGRLPDIVVATHGHYDHAGLGSAWQRAGAAVALGAADAGLATQPGGQAEAVARMLEELVAASGAPAGVAKDAMAAAARRQAEAAAARDTYPPARPRSRWPTGLRFEPFIPRRLLEGDCPLPAGLRALACPGHTPGNVVIVHDREGWLFSGDQLLPDITPTPGLQLAPGGSGERFRSLPHFLRSLRRLERLSVETCFPGHGEAFSAAAETVAANVRVIEERTARVLAALEAAGAATAYELGERLYPRALQRRFWQILPTVVGHLDLLEERGLAVYAEGRWQPAPS